MENVSKIEITIDGENIACKTQLNPIEVVFWLEYLKAHIISGELRTADE